MKGSAITGPVAKECVCAQCPLYISSADTDCRPIYGRVSLQMLAQSFRSPIFLTRHNHHAFVCLCNNKYGMHYEDTNCYQITELHCKIRMKEIAIHAWVVPVMVISLLA